MTPGSNNTSLVTRSLRLLRNLTFDNVTFGLVMSSICQKYSCIDYSPYIVDLQLYVILVFTTCNQLIFDIVLVDTIPGAPMLQTKFEVHPTYRLGGDRDTLSISLDTHTHTPLHRVVTNRVIDSDSNRFESPF